MFKRKPRYRHAGLQAGSNQPLFPRRIVSTAAVAQNPPHHQFLFIALNHVVSTSVKWTLHAKTRSMQKVRRNSRLLLNDHHESYLSWHDFERKQRLITDNATSKGLVPRGALRRGELLLGGLLRCGHCGRKLRGRLLHRRSPNRRRSAKSV